MRFSGSIDNEINLRYLHMISAVKIDNLHANQIKLDSPHLHWQQTVLEERDVLERLIRVNQNYKTNLQHSLNRNKKFNIPE